MGIGESHMHGWRGRNRHGQGRVTSRQTLSHTASTPMQPSTAHACHALTTRSQTTRMVEWSYMWEEARDGLIAGTNR